MILVLILRSVGLQIFQLPLSLGWGCGTSSDTGAGNVSLHGGNKNGGAVLILLRPRVVTLKAGYGDDMARYGMRLLGLTQCVVPGSHLLNVAEWQAVELTLLSNVSWYTGWKVGEIGLVLKSVCYHKLLPITFMMMMVIMMVSFKSRPFPGDLSHYGIIGWMLILQRN